MTHLPASRLPCLTLFADPPFPQVTPWKSNHPRLGSQQAPFAGAVTYLKGMEACANPVSDLNLESLIFNGGISAGCTGGPLDSSVLNVGKAARAIVLKRGRNQTNGVLPYLAFFRNSISGVMNLAVCFME